MSKSILKRLGWVACAGLMGAGCVDADVPPKLEALADSGVGDGGVECSTDGRLGEPCQVGEGSCQQIGEYLCTAEGVVCSVEALPAFGRQELCGTGRDEDCDGTVDEAPEDRCCADGDCGGGACLFPQVEGEGGQGAQVTTQGGTCVGEGSAPGDSGLSQSAGGGLTAGGGYALQLRIGGPGPIGTMGGAGKVLRIGPGLSR